MVDNVLVEDTMNSVQNNETVTGFAACSTDSLPEQLPLTRVAHENGGI